MIKSHIPAVNTPARIEVPTGQSGSAVVSESTTRMKRGRHSGAKDKVPRKRKLKGHTNEVGILGETSKNMIRILDKSNVGEHISPEEKQVAPEEAQVLDNKEISINYLSNENLWD